ncbi:MAG: FMN-binding protein [Oscillospiraceae bacterium]
MTKEKFNEYIKPFVVLVVICLVVAFLLAFTNSKTAPIIEENARIEAERIRSEVLPGASGFEPVECDTDALGIDSAYRETNGLGYVITASYKGYGGDVTVTVGIDNDGYVVGMNANVSTETTGVGSKAGQSDYTDRFIGISGSADGIDTISNATYSSTAVKTGVSAALSAFDAIKEAE